MRGKAPRPLRRLGRHASALLLLPGLAGCVANGAPQVLGPDAVASYVAPPFSGRTALPACGNDPLAAEARAGLADFADVVGATNSCDLPQLRYQLSQRGRYTAALSALAEAPGACGTEARALERRIAAWSATVQRGAVRGVNACGARLVGDDAEAITDDLRGQTQDWSRRMTSDFSEISQ